VEHRFWVELRATWLGTKGLVLGMKGLVLGVKLRLVPKP
jgi:hypothetical protein